MELKTLEIRISRNENLPTLPQVALMVLKRADDPLAGARELEVIINSDPSMAAKVLKVANSAAYGGGNVTTLGRAVALLGMSMVKSLVVNLSFQHLISRSESATRFNTLEYWRHSLAVATASREIAKLKKLPYTEEMYGIGMLHNIGMLMLTKFCTLEFDAAVQISQTSDSPLHESERQIIGWDHCDAGALLADKWGLSPRAKAAIRFHHNPAFDEEFFVSTSIIHIADALAFQVGMTNNTPNIVPELQSFILEELDLNDEKLEKIRETTVEFVMKAQRAFGLN